MNVKAGVYIFGLSEEDDYLCQIPPAFFRSLAVRGSMELTPLQTG
jgi:hypothetical protein